VNLWIKRLEFTVIAMPIDVLDKAIEDYDLAEAGSTAYMALVDRPFRWLDSVSKKLQLLRMLRELRKCYDSLEVGGESNT